MAYTVLDFKPDTALLNPRFDGYKLRVADSYEATRVFPFESKAASPRKLSSSAPLSYDESYFRVHYNHLFIGPDDGTFVYVDSSCIAHMIRADKHGSPQTTVLFSIPMQDGDSAVAGYPGAYTLSETVILLFDGLESVYVLWRSPADSDTDEQWAAAGVFRLGPGPMAAGPTESSMRRSMYHIISAALVHEAGQAAIRLHVCYRADRVAKATTGKPALPPFCIDAVQVDLLQPILAAHTPDLQTASRTVSLDTLCPRVVHTLRSHAIPVYCENMADNMYLLGVRDGIELDDTERMSRPHSPSEAPLPAVPPHIPDLYYWSQTSSDVTMCIELPVSISAQQIQCVLTRVALNLQFIDAPECESRHGFNHAMLCHEIVADESVWTLENGRLLTLYLQKVREGARWPTLFTHDDGVLETMDPNEFAVIRERLQQLTSESLDLRRPPGVPTIPLATDAVDPDSDELEQENSSVVFSVRDWRTGQASASSVAGSPDWLCPSFPQPLSHRQNALPPVCLRFDVDGTVFGFGSTEEAMRANASVDAHAGTAACPRHWGTFAALSYIQASKREKRFMYVDSDLTVAVLAETQRRIYIYHQVASTNSATAAQSIVDLGHSDTAGESEDVLGIQLAGRVLVVLREHSICTVDLDRC